MVDGARLLSDEDLEKVLLRCVQMALEASNNKEAAQYVVEARRYRKEWYRRQQVKSL